MTKLEELLKLLDGIQGLPAVALVCFTCVVVGYALRFIRPFPNQAIPVVVILWGAVAMLLLADARPTTMSPRIWTARNFSVGLIVGMLAWLLHKLVLARIEDLIAKRFPGSNDTAFFNKTDVAPEPPKPPTPLN